MPYDGFQTMAVTDEVSMDILTESEAMLELL